MDNGADAYPNDPNRWGDSDGDGYDDGLDDDCPALFGTSVHDRKGCPDQDGDGYSDPDSGWTTANGADAFMTDSTQWNDTDGDGYGDNPAGAAPDACPTPTVPSWQNGTYGCPDGDQDGWGDDQDTHPTDPTQWSDADGDGYGDNPGGTLPDACPTVWGNSTQGNRLGCPDNDGDGWDNSIDALPDLPTQWLDQDGDGYGDNATGIQPDACPGEAGTSSIGLYGCVDDDGDGHANLTDDFPNDPTRWIDSDGDGYDDAEDACPFINGQLDQDRVGCLDTDADGFSNPTPPVGNNSGWNTSNGADAFPDEPTQAVDGDGDGYGDNPSGVPSRCLPDPSRLLQRRPIRLCGRRRRRHLRCQRCVPWKARRNGSTPTATATATIPTAPSPMPAWRRWERPPWTCTAARTATGTVPAMPTTCGPTTPRSGLTATGTATATRPKGRTAMPVRTISACQPPATPWGAPTATATGGRTSRTRSPTSGASKWTATGTATATTPRSAPTSPTTGPTMPPAVQPQPA